MRSSTRNLSLLASVAAASLLGGGFAMATPGTPADTAPRAASTAPSDEQNVVGGREVTTPYPWMTYLDLTKTDGRSSFCGGSQISRDTILTAAHCMDGTRSISVRIGSVDKTRGGTVRTVSQWRFGPGTRRGDWAVLKLSQPFDNSEYMQLPGDTSLNAGPTFRGIGWGAERDGAWTYPTKLREVDLPFIASGQADCRYGEAEICAGNLSQGGIDTCQGDSGGPLVIKDRRGRWTQVGIVSWGDGCAARGRPGHYAKVTTYLNDIRGAISQLGGTLPTNGPTPPPSTDPGPTNPGPTNPGPTPGPTTPDPTGPEPSDGTVLLNGRAITVSGARGSEQFYTVGVPVGARNLRIETSGGSGDLDLFVKAGERPTNTSYDCRPYRSGNNEACVTLNPTPGTTYVRLRAFAAYRDVTLRATWE